jgi:hypothetical protein
MNFDRQNEPTGPSEIARFEAERRITLPADYKDFLLKFNGGRPADDYAFARIAGRSALVLETLHGLTENPEHSIDADHFTNFSDYIHERFLEIGSANSDILFMDFREGANYGRIYLRAHDSPPNDPILIDDAGFEDEDDYEEARLLHPVADSFSAFVAMLGPVPDRG